MSKPALGDKVGALIFEADDGQVTKVTYKATAGQACKMANLLRSKGVKKGDRARSSGPPMTVEGIVAMQALASRHPLRRFRRWLLRPVSARPQHRRTAGAVVADDLRRPVPRRQVDSAQLIADEAFAMGVRLRQTLLSSSGPVRR